MEHLVGKVAIVTGASSGIGAAIAEKLVADGMKVAGVGRRVENIEKLSVKLQNKSGKLYAVKADLTKEEDIKNVLKWVTLNLGPVDVLVNNAGLVKGFTLLDISNADVKTTFDTNVIALTILSRDVVNNMINNKTNGHIININSIAGHSVLNYSLVNVYSGTKFAVTALTETLRKELARLGSKIRITSLSPGLVKTEIATAEEGKKLMESAPILQGEDIANAVAYILNCPAHVNITEMVVQPVGELL